MTITERLRQLSIAVADQNWREFSMRVPAEPDHDADIVIMKAAMLIESRDAEVAELVAALKPFGAIDLVESRLPAEFAMLILRARAAIAKVRKP